MQSCHPMPALVEESFCRTSLAVVVRAVGLLTHLGANDLHLRIDFNNYNLGANELLNPVKTVEKPQNLSLDLIDLEVESV